MGAGTVGPHHVHPPARGRSWAWRPRHLHPMTRPGAQWCQGNATQSSTQGLARRQALCLHPLPAACQPWRPLDGACLTKRPRPCDHQALLPVLLQVLVPREFFPLTPFSICAAPSPEALVKVCFLFFAARCQQSCMRFFSLPPACACTCLSTTCVLPSELNQVAVQPALLMVVHAGCSRT
jgi:hypothetical protein